MTITEVDVNSTEIEHLTAVDVVFSGVHIGGGIYFSANHVPAPGGSHTAVPQQGLATPDVTPHDTTEIDYTLPDDVSLWSDYMEDIGIGFDVVMAGYDMSMQVGDTFGTPAGYYSGPAAPLLIANDASDLIGAVTVVGYPNNGAQPSYDGVTLHESTGALTAASYTEENVNGDIGGFFEVFGADAVSGMSGGGAFLDIDLDGDLVTETYLIGTSSRALTYTDAMGDPVATSVISTSFAPHYAELAEDIEGLAVARSADDFARMALLSAQTLGSTNTFVRGEFFHEDLYGGVNNDTLSGGGGDDLLLGRGGADRLIGGTGDDTLTGGAGADWFHHQSFGTSGTDVITDFDASSDLIDLFTIFGSLSEVVAATTEDTVSGSIFIAIPAASGGGTIEVFNTTISDLNDTNVNVLCFAAGTRIVTAAGERPVETLRPGDMVLTRTNGLQPLHAIHTRCLSTGDLAERPNLWPVHVARDALGPGCPARTLRVSPQHRILATGPIAERMAGGEVLIAAIRLCALPGVTQPRPQEAVTYLHLVFRRHEVVMANGCWSESFCPGPQAMRSLPKHLAREYTDIFGALNAGPAIVEGAKARNLVARHLKNNKHLQEVELSSGNAALSLASLSLYPCKDHTH